MVFRKRGIGLCAETHQEKDERGKHIQVATHIAQGRSDAVTYNASRFWFNARCPHTNSLHGRTKKTGQTQAHSESPEAIMSLTRCSNQYVAAFGDSKLDLKEFIDQAFIPNWGNVDPALQKWQDVSWPSWVEGSFWVNLAITWGAVGVIAGYNMVWSWQEPA